VVGCCGCAAVRERISLIQGGGGDLKPFETRCEFTVFGAAFAQLPRNKNGNWFGALRGTSSAQAPT